MLTKTKRLSILFAFVFLLFKSATVKAQQEVEAITEKKSYFKVSADYLSNSVYYGRRDSLRLPYLSATFSYHHKSGVYADVSLSYLASKDQSQLDATTITAGYSFHDRNEKLYGDVYAYKSFNNSASYSVKSDINAGAGSYISYDAGPATIAAGANVAFSTKTDISLNLGLSHTFEFGNNSNWSVVPSAVVNAGTQNFYESYYANRKYSIKRRRRGSATAPVNVSVIKKDFSVLDYELSSPLYYDDNKWGLFFTPTYAIPVNPVQFSINGVPFKTEALKSSLYVEVGAYVKF